MQTSDGKRNRLITMRIPVGSLSLELGLKISGVGTALGRGTVVLRVSLSHLMTKQEFNLGGAGGLPETTRAMSSAPSGGSA
jgi:hypothetical protein